MADLREQDGRRLTNVRRKTERRENETDEWRMRIQESKLRERKEKTAKHTGQMNNSEHRQKEE